MNDTNRGYDKRLRELGITLPPIPPRAGEYLVARRHDNLIFSSGQGPIKDGKPIYTGRVGGELTLEQGYEAARQTILNALAAVCSLLPSINNIDKIVELNGFVNSAPDFFDQPKVINGASELLIKIFGDQGRHARTAIGVGILPGNIPVEIKMIVAVG